MSPEDACTCIGNIIKDKTPTGCSVIAMVDCFPGSVYQGEGSALRDEVFDFPYGI